AIGNVAMQILATGAAPSLQDVRAIIERSYPPEVFEPRDTDQWDRQADRFDHYCEATHVLGQKNAPPPRFLGRERCGYTRRTSSRATSLSLQFAWRGPSHHQFRRRQHQLKV